MVSMRIAPAPVWPSATASWREVAAGMESTPPAFQQLSPAEQVVLAQLRQGLTNKEIARALGKAVSTVKNQVAAILAKSGAPNRARLIASLHG